MQAYGEEKCRRTLTNILTYSGVADEDSRSCQRRIEWCTTNDLEKEKCSWLSAATRTFGMNPSVECSTTADNKWKCLRKIAERKANIVSIPTDDGYIARK